MIIRCGVPGADRLPPAYRRAANIRNDLGRAVGLYAIGDRSELILKTLAHAKVVYDAIGYRVPIPRGVNPERWPVLLDALVDSYGYVAFDDTPCAAYCAC